jgi:tryptophanyl-tRNA synthetase
MVKTMLTEEQKLYLELLAEEAAEVIHIKSKIIRFGLLDCYQNLDKGDNKKRLETEIGHFNAVVFRLADLGIIDLASVEREEQNKDDEYTHNKHRKKLCG